MAVLKKISSSTGGIPDAANNITALSGVLKNAVSISAVRNLLIPNSGGFLYSALRILFFSVIGLFFGFAAYNVFSYKPLFAFFLLRGVISGIFAGFSVELPGRAGIAPALCRIIAAALLSTIPFAREKSGSAVSFPDTSKNYKSQKEEAANVQSGKLES